VATATTQVKILIPGHQPMVALLGQQDVFLKLIESAFSSDILVRGNEITITGPEQEAEQLGRLFEELLALLEKGHELSDTSVGQTIELIKGGDRAAGSGDETATMRPSDVLGDTLLTARGKSVSPKTIGQKRFVDAMRSSTVTFAIGPAGTGKTYLAVATAVRALQDRQVSRLILTRPAVEAGERLGFLPGTLYEKIDPYMRPLYDALFEMTGGESLSRLMEKGTVEVAPLAFMRGRAQPVDRTVLTPQGFRPIGELQVGDLVVASDGQPTPVLGVFPQGRKEVFRVVAQDGASTLCCSEHLWAVTTAADRRRGRGRRVVETKEMVGRSRAAHQHRFELPLVSRPVEFLPQDVPLDPYALGVLLGDGCVTTSTTPSFATADPELALALEMALPSIEVIRKGTVDHVLRHGRRGGVRTLANPVTSVLRELDLAGARSSTKFVPDAYLFNSSDVRLGVLQGLLDTDGGPVTQARRTCRIQYCTTSPRLRDDVVFLVRSLGGVAYARTRSAAGRPPGRARGRDVHHRSDAFVLDIRLPADIEPFRLTRKAVTYRVFGGGGRPMRFVDRIEPAGAAETVCIQVAAEDSLYVTDDFLVTHNTLNDAFIILDEAQNTTPEQMKMFLTRIGFGSKAVVNGDDTQVDLIGGQTSGLRVIEEILSGIKGISFCRLGGRDVVRHRIVQDIVEAYDRYGQQALGMDD
jgi:phosphate starvation-inducible protein PhoH and related proteins